jgi:hypothetical protein
MSLNCVRIPSLLNSKYFETHFFNRLERALEHNPKHVIFDMRSMVWCDLKELICIPLAICWLKSQNICTEVLSFRPFLSTNLEYRLLENLDIDPTLVSKHGLERGKRNNKYGDYTAFFWGTLIPLKFFDQLMDMDVPCSLEDWDGKRIPLNQAVIEVLAPKERASLRYYGIQDVYVHWEVDSAVDNVRRIIDNYDFEDKDQITNYLEIITNTAENIFDHAYTNLPNYPEHLKKGLLCIRVFPKKGFGQIIKHSREEIRQYLDFLRNKEVLSVSVGDAGNGIWKVLDPKRNMSELACIKSAFDKYVSSKQDLGPYNPKFGEGLYEVQKAINTLGGYLEIRSGRSRYVMTSKVIVPKKIITVNDVSVDGQLNEFPGVQYTIYLPINGNLRKDKQLRLFD